MSDSVLADNHKERDPRGESREGRGFFGRIALFVRQVVAELKRVVTPPRDEFIKMIWIVLGFVAVVMLVVFGLDIVFSWGAEQVFGR